MLSFYLYFCLLIFTSTWNAKYEPEETVVFYSRKTRRTNRRTFSTLKTASLSTTANEITEPMLDVSAGGAKCTLNQAQADCDRDRDPDPMQSVYDVLSMYIGMYIMYMNVEVY